MLAFKFFSMSSIHSRAFEKHLATLGIVRLCSVPNALAGVILVQLGSRFHKPLLDAAGRILNQSRKPCLCNTAHFPRYKSQTISPWP